MPSHDRPVTSLAFSPDGALLATTSEDRTAVLWRRDGSRAAVLEPHLGAVTAIAWSPDGATLVTASTDRGVRVWDAAGTLRTLCKGHQSSVTAVAYAPDGATFATASMDGSVRVWSSSGEEVARLRPHEGGAVSVAFIEGGARLLVVTRGAAVRVWDVARREVVLRLEGAQAAEAVDGGRAPARYAGAHGDKLHLWDAEGRALGTVVTQNVTAGRVTWAFSDDGAMLAVGGGTDGSIDVYDTARGAPLAMLEGHTGAVRALAWCGSLLVSGAEDASVRVHTADGGAVHAWTGLGDHVFHLRVAAGRWIAAASLDGGVVLFDLEQTERVAPRRSGSPDAVLAPVARLPHPNATSVLSLGGGRLVTGGFAKAEEPAPTLRIWTGTESAAELDAGVVTSMVLAPDGRHVIAMGFRNVAVVDAREPRLCWRTEDSMARLSPEGAGVLVERAGSIARLGLATGAEEWRVDAPPGKGIARSAWSPDRRRVLLSRDDSATALLLSTDDGSRVAEVPKGRTAAFSPDGGWLVVDGDGALGVFDTRTGIRMGSIDVAAAGSGAEVKQWRPETVQWIDASRIVVAPDRGTVRVFDVGGALTDAIPMTTWLGVGQIAVSPDASRLVIGTQPGETVVWDLAEHALVLRMHLRGGFSKGQFDPSGRRLFLFSHVTPCPNRVIQLFDPRTGLRLATLAGHARTGPAVAGDCWDKLHFSPDGTAVVTVLRNDTRARIWGTEAGELRGLLPNDADVRGVAFEQDRVWTAGGGEVRAWSPAPL